MTEERYFISMLSDYGFKITFGNLSDTLFLRTSIQALIQSYRPIVSVEFNRNEATGLTKTSGGGLFDISCIDSAGHHYIIEMQLTDVKTFIKRSTFYASHRYTSIIRKGKWRFKDLKKVYMISILDGIVYSESTEYHHIGSLRNQHGELMGDEITQVVFELGKWNKQVENIKSDIDKLIYVMKVTEKLKVNEAFTPPPFWSEEWIENAIEQLDMGKMTPEDREYAERQIVKAVAMAEERKSKLEAELKAEQSNQRTENAVIKLLKRDMTPNEVAEILDISLDKVMKIKAQADG